MKKVFAWMLVVGFVSSLALVGYCISSHETNAKKANVEMSVEVPNVIKTEVKENYKLDNAEYKSAVSTPRGESGSYSFVDFGLLLKMTALLGIILAFGSEVIKQHKGKLAFSVLMVGGYLLSSNSELQLAAMPLAGTILFQRDGDGGAGNGLTKEQLTEVMEEVSKKQGTAIKVAVDNAIKEASKGQLTQDMMNGALKALGLEEGVIKRLDDAMKAQGIKMKELETPKSTANWKSNIKKSFTPDQIAKAHAAFKNGAGGVDIFGGVDKVVAEIETGNVSTDTGGNALLDLINADDIRSMNLRSPFVDQFATVTRTAKPIYTYADYKPKDGGVGFVGENAAKSQLDFQVVVKTVAPKKAAGYEILTEEAVTDVPRLQSEAVTVLLKKFLLKRQNGILFGDGNNDTPLGVTAQAPAFDAATWGDEPVVDPNLYDCIVAAANQIIVSENYADEMQYYPNVAFMNPKDLSGLKLKKNEFGMYLFPQFQLNGDNQVDDLKLVAKKEIPSGKLLIGDFTMLRIINYIDYNIRMGWINDQFIKNLFTMVGEGRFFTVIRDLDKIAFVYDDIATIKAGITA